MTRNKISLLMLGAAAVLASCSDIDKQNPEGDVITSDQIKETNEAISSRADAVFSGMFSMMGEPFSVYGSKQGRADDFGYVMMAFSQDVEGADAVVQNSGYNWFSACADMTTRDPSYANPYTRYKHPYNQIGVANEVLASVEEGSNKWAQAKAMRAFAYMQLAPYFQFGYTGHKDEPCIPILSDGVDYTNNPRATVAEVYDAILTDLTDAIDALKENPTSRGADKTKIDINVAYGLRARAYLTIGEYANAAADAEKAMEGYTPATINEVSTPTFTDMAEHNWIWAIDITDDMVSSDGYPTSCSWVGSFSGNSYSAGTGCYVCCNVMLYNKIPATDVRKGWWLDENLHSPLLEGLSWNEAQGQDIATYEYDDKVAFLPYTNVKFGMKSGIGGTVNNNDWPLMRVEEMILIQAEGLAKSGNESQARTVLENFVKTYRDPSYTVNGRQLSLADEIWFQRRVELWGEGFFTADMKRLGKPLVRFHQGEANNWPEAYQFNMTADDPWLNMRFTQTEMNNNKAIVDNTGGTLPVAGQNGQLRDGVTD